MALSKKITDITNTILALAKSVFLQNDAGVLKFKDSRTAGNFVAIPLSTLYWAGIWDSGKTYYKGAIVGSDLSAGGLPQILSVCTSSLATGGSPISGAWSIMVQGNLGGNGGGNNTAIAKVTVTREQILALNTNPVTLLDAPGEGYSVIIDNIIISVGNNDYSNSNIFIKQNDFIITEYTLSDIIGLNNSGGSGLNYNESNIPFNSATILSADSAITDSGVSDPIDIYIHYYILNLATGQSMPVGYTESDPVFEAWLAGQAIQTINKPVYPFSVQIYNATTAVDTSAIFYWLVPQCYNGLKIQRATAMVNTAGTTGATTIQVRNMTQFASNDALQILYPISIASGYAVATAGTIDTSYNALATNDVIKIYVTGVSTTAPLGLQVLLEIS